MGGWTRDAGHCGERSNHVDIVGDSGVVPLTVNAAGLEAGLWTSSGGLFNAGRDGAETGGHPGDG